MYRSQFKKIDPYDWFCGPWSQMLISGLDWCDFVIYVQDDMMIQRIYKDIKMFQTIREKADLFFFFLLLPAKMPTDVNQKPFGRLSG